jgi:hypothetical protein
MPSQVATDRSADFAPATQGFACGIAKLDDPDLLVVVTGYGCTKRAVEFPLHAGAFLYDLLQMLTRKRATVCAVLHIRYCLNNHGMLRRFVSASG